jgi:hypothetical protein
MNIKKKCYSAKLVEVFSSAWSFYPWLHVAIERHPSQTQKSPSLRLSKIPRQYLEEKACDCLGS